MPRQDAAAWREARELWETTDMTLSDAAARLDVALPTVSVRAKKELWVKADVVSLDRASYTPKQLVELSIRALMRAASQTKDHASAIKAAGMLLDRTMGRVEAVQERPMLSPSEAMPDDPAEWPAWLTQRRLAYQEGRQSEPEALEAPDPALPPTEPLIASPALHRDPANHIPEPPPKLHAVPQWFDAPGRPAQGAQREPDRLSPPR